jgi:hypothetical protein
VIRPVRPTGDETVNARFGFSLDFWWLYLFYLGALPRTAALLVPALSAALAAYCLHRAWTSAVAWDRT